MTAVLVGVTMIAGQRLGWAGALENLATYLSSS